MHGRGRSRRRATEPPGAGSYPGCMERRAVAEGRTAGAGTLRSGARLPARWAGPGRATIYSRSPPPPTPAGGRLRSPGRPGRCGSRGWSQSACQSGLGEGRRPGTSAASATWRVPGPHPWLRWAHGPVGADPRVSSTLVLQPKFCFFHFVPACPVSVGPLLRLCSSGLGAALIWYPQLREVTPCALPFRDSPELVPSLGPCGPTWE